MNETKAKQKQKAYYDKKARNREFEIGQKVLVLLPTQTFKLLASHVGYRIIVRGGKQKVFHINMLKLWHEWVII